MFSLPTDSEYSADHIKLLLNMNWHSQLKGPQLEVEPLLRNQLVNFLSTHHSPSTRTSLSSMNNSYRLISSEIILSPLLFNISPKPFTFGRLLLRITEFIYPNTVAESVITLMDFKFYVILQLKPLTMTSSSVTFMWFPSFLKSWLATKFTLQLFDIKIFTMSHSAVL